MRSFTRWVAPATLLALAPWWAAPAAGKPGRQDERIRVLIIDGQNNHDWRATTPLLKAALDSTGRFQVDVCSHRKPGDRPGQIGNTVPFPPDLDRYAVVVSNYNGEPWPAAFQKSLEQHVRDGRLGLVIVHAADNAFPAWAEYNRMAGLGWRDNRFGDRLIVDAQGREVRVPRGQGRGAGHGARHPFVVAIRDPDHPITRGMPRRWRHAADELYHGLRGPAEHMHLLATAYSDKRYGGTGEQEPMIWTVDYGKGRVFHTPMGHDPEAMRCVGFRATLERGVEWAATGAVTIPLPRDFPTAGRTTSAAPAGTLDLVLRRRVPVRSDPGRFEVVEHAERWDPARTALIVCDMWDLHHCRRAVLRGREMAPRMNAVLRHARDRGVLIIHAPSECMAAYEGTPMRRRARAAPQAGDLPPDIASWCDRIPAEAAGRYPIDQSDGGEDDEPAEHARCAAELTARGRNPRAPW